MNTFATNPKLPPVTSAMCQRNDCRRNSATDDSVSTATATSTSSELSSLGTQMAHAPFEPSNECTSPATFDRPPPASMGCIVRNSPRFLTKHVGKTIRGVLSPNSGHKATTTNGKRDKSSYRRITAKDLTAAATPSSRSNMIQGNIEIPSELMEEICVSLTPECRGSFNETIDTDLFAMEKRSDFKTSNDCVPKLEFDAFFPPSEPQTPKGSSPTYSDDESFTLSYLLSEDVEQKKAQQPSPRSVISKSLEDIQDESWPQMEGSEDELSPFGLPSSDEAEDQLSPTSRLKRELDEMEDVMEQLKKAFNFNPVEINPTTRHMKSKSVTMQIKSLPTPPRRQRSISCPEGQLEPVRRQSCRNLMKPQELPPAMPKRKRSLSAGPSRRRSISSTVPPERGSRPSRRSSLSSSTAQQEQARGRSSRSLMSTPDTSTTKHSSKEFVRRRSVRSLNQQELQPIVSQASKELVSRGRSRRSLMKEQVPPTPKEESRRVRKGRLARSRGSRNVMDQEEEEQHQHQQEQPPAKTPPTSSTSSTTTTTIYFTKEDEEILRIEKRLAMLKAKKAERLARSSAFRGAQSTRTCFL